MEIHSYETYIDTIIAKFNENDFSPEKARDIPGLLNSKIGIDSPYWKIKDVGSFARGGTFYIEFKKYGKNTNDILLKFSFSPPLIDSRVPRSLVLTVVDEELNEINDITEEISLSEIWKDHSVLSKVLKKYVKLGLELAEKTDLHR